MRREIWLAIAVCALVMTGRPILADNAADVRSNAHFDECVRIQSGYIFDSSGEALTVGYNEWGYNYQAHQFNGGFEVLY